MLEAQGQGSLDTIYYYASVFSDHTCAQAELSRSPVLMPQSDSELSLGPDPKHNLLVVAL